MSAKLLGVHLYWYTKQYQRTSALQTESLKQSRSFALPFLLSKTVSQESRREARVWVTIPLFILKSISGNRKVIV